MTKCTCSEGDESEYHYLSCAILQAILKAEKNNS